MRMIDGDALIEALLEARHEETETTLKLVRFIRKQPTIEPSLLGTQMSLSKRGRWKWTGVGVLCSSCNYKLQTTGIPSYCPYCGAIMEEKK